jgi:hypothetical protein
MLHNDVDTNGSRQIGGTMMWTPMTVTISEAQ